MARILSVFQYSFPGAQFLTFEHVTLVPYEPKLIDYSLLSEVQVSRPNEPRREKTCLRSFRPGPTQTRCTTT